MSQAYVHHEIACAPRCWFEVAKEIQLNDCFKKADGKAILYGLWRSQIGLPRDVLSMITVWPDMATALSGSNNILCDVQKVESHSATLLVPTLRPQSSEPPIKQGNYAFRWFITPKKHFEEFLRLCEDSWPSFESSFDSQIIGLWRRQDTNENSFSSLLLTRRPNLSMWDRSKIPNTPEEVATREKLKRRYDLCEHTIVYTTTLLTAIDAKDTVSWS